MGIPEDHPAILDAVRKGLIAPTPAAGSFAGGQQLPPPPRPAKARPGVRTAAPRRLVLEADVPARTAVEANTRGPARAYMARKKAVRGLVAAELPALAGGFPLPARVTLTRYGVKRLDGDNLANALKFVRDQVAEWLGVDDADKRVRWRYRQRPFYGPKIRVRVEHRGC